MIRTLIADDHDLFRAGLIAVLAAQTDIEVVGEARTSYEVLDQVCESEPDVLILDLSMPGRGGLEIAREVSNKRPKTAILVVTAHPEDSYAIRCLRSGADGYVTKTSSTDTLLEAIRRVARGRKCISTTLAEKLAVSLDNGHQAEPHLRLSDRELQVLSKMGSGRSATEIANELCLSVKTVSTYRSRILEKLDLDNNAQLMRYAIENGFTEEPAAALQA